MSLKDCKENDCKCGQETRINENVERECHSTSTTVNYKPKSDYATFVLDDVVKENKERK